MEFGSLAGRETIMPNDLWAFYVDVRAQFLDAINKITDSTDAPDQNRRICQNLNKIYAYILGKMSRYGKYIITIHYDCGRSTHLNSSIEHKYDVKINFQDQNYKRKMIFHGHRNRECPCSNSRESTDHSMSDWIVYDSENIYANELNEFILSEIIYAIELSRKSRPRSAIRECLLRTVIKVNDLILPNSVDHFISNNRRWNGADEL